MIGSTCLVQGVRPILFPSHVPRIDIFCLTHRRCRVLLPAGSIRSSSLVSQSVQRLPQTNGASSSRLSSSTIPIGFRVFRTIPMHMLMQNSQKLHFTGPQLKASLPLPLWWGFCNVNFETPSQLRHEPVVHIESSWNLQTENQVWRSPTLSQKLLETETYTKLKISPPFLRALWI